jgi:hypothetical protein
MLAGGMCNLCARAREISGNMGTAEASAVATGGHCGVVSTWCSSPLDAETSAGTLWKTPDRSAGDSRESWSCCSFVDRDGEVSLTGVAGTVIVAGGEPFFSC